MVDQLADGMIAQAGREVSARRARPVTTTPEQLPCQAADLGIGPSSPQQIAFVTAAGQGIGRAIGEAFIAEGARVIATDLDAGKLAGLATARSAKLDIRSSAAVDALAGEVTKEFGPPDIVVNCMNFDTSTAWCSVQAGDWDFSFDHPRRSRRSSMLHAHCTRLHDGRRRRGAIVNVSSVVSSIRGVPNRYIYGAYQGGDHRPHQGGSHRLHPARHQGKRNLPRDHRNTLARRARRGPRQDDRPKDRQGAPWTSSIASPCGQARHGCRSRGAGGINGVGTRQVSSLTRRISSMAAWRCED